MKWFNKGKSMGLIGTIICLIIIVILGICFFSLFKECTRPYQDYKVGTNSFNFDFEIEKMENDGITYKIKTTNNSYSDDPTQETIMNIKSITINNKTYKYDEESSTDATPKGLKVYKDGQLDTIGIFNLKEQNASFLLKICCDQVNSIDEYEGMKILFFENHIDKNINKHPDMKWNNSNTFMQLEKNK